MTHELIITIFRGICFAAALFGIALAGLAGIREDD